MAFSWLFTVRRYVGAQGFPSAFLCSVSSFCHLMTSIGLTSLLVRLEDSFGIVPAADGSGLSLNPKAPHAPKAAMAIEVWAEKRAQVENGEIDADEYEDWKASL